MGRWVTVRPIHHDKGCGIGCMEKSTLTDDNGNPVMFAIVNEVGKTNFNSIVFQGICDTCHQEFRKGYIIESFLVYREV